MVPSILKTSMRDKAIWTWPLVVSSTLNIPFDGTLIMLSGCFDFKSRNYLLVRYSVHGISVTPPRLGLTLDGYASCVLCNLAGRGAPPSSHQTQDVLERSSSNGKALLHSAEVKGRALSELYPFPAMHTVTRVCQSMSVRTRPRMVLWNYKFPCVTL